MTLWNIIRDFFVVYVFGGCDSSRVFHEGNFLGYVGNSAMSEEDYLSSSALMIKIDNAVTNINISDNGTSTMVNDFYISFADWLSTTATIITLCLLVFVLYLLVRWIFRQFSNIGR